MANIEIITTHSEGEVVTTSLPTLEMFVEHILQRARSERKAPPFLTPAEVSEDEAMAVGAPQLTGRCGAIVMLEDGSLQFVEAKPGKVIMSGSGEVSDADLHAKVELCRKWLERFDHTDVVVREVFEQDEDKLKALREAERKQQAALNAARDNASPANVQALGEAMEERHQAQRAADGYRPTAAAAQSVVAAPRMYSMLIVKGGGAAFHKRLDAAGYSVFRKGVYVLGASHRGELLTKVDAVTADVPAGALIDALILTDRDYAAIRTIEGSQSHAN